MQASDRKYFIPLVVALGCLPLALLAVIIVGDAAAWHVGLLLAGLGLGAWIGRRSLRSRMGRRMDKVLDAAGMALDGRTPVMDDEVQDDEGMQRIWDGFEKLAARSRFLEGCDSVPFHRLLNSMSDGFLAINLQQRILYINPAARTFFNIGDADVANRQVAEVIRRNSLNRAISEALASEESVRTTLPPKSASSGVTLGAHCMPWNDADGRLAGLVIVLSDTTRLARLEKIRRDFVANVSHELKTPITSLRGYSETLLDDDNIPAATRRRFIETMHRQALRLENIIDDLLNLSRIEAGADTFPSELQPLRPIVQEAIETCRLKAADRQVRIEFSCQDNPSSPVNANLLEQAVVNLITNAIKYGPDGGEVRITLARHDNAVDISVSDQGDGIPAEHIPRLFERFYRIDKARAQTQGSTGLGLAIVRHIMILHQGSVSVKSELGHGSTFTLRLPLVRKEAAPAD